MPGLDGAIEIAMSGMIVAQQRASDGTENSEGSEGRMQPFGLARPIMSGIRARIGFLRKRADTAPAKLETLPRSSDERPRFGTKFNGCWGAEGSWTY